MAKIGETAHLTTEGEEKLLTNKWGEEMAHQVS
jgi:hypothetical protein